MPYQIAAFGQSDVGLVRQNNEDVWDEQPALKFYVLADGMGGHRAGEVAAREAVKELCRILIKELSNQKAVSLSKTCDLVRNAIIEVNKIIYKLGHTDAHLRGMGTTLCCVYFYDEWVILAHVGDSRIYRLHEKKLEQVTVDHSLLRELIELGQLPDRVEPSFLYKNILTRAIGTEPSVEPSVQVCDAVCGDIYLMSSDGLSDMLTQEEIEVILNSYPSITDATHTLIAEAREKGGYDNITVVTMKIQNSK